jgi:tetraacyldisaccharide 4'-kinase
MVGLLPSAKAGVPVIAVGNLTVGGAGKTPVTLELAKRFLDGGRRVAVVSRGYGRTTKGTVIVSDGQAVRAGADDGGDEPLWLARQEPRLIVVVGEKRAAAASTAVDLGADLVLLDDGLSHYSLQRDAKVIVIDDQARFGNGFLLPAGPLRLRLSHAHQADLLWWTRVDEPKTRRPEPRNIDGIPSVHSAYRAGRLVDLQLAAKEPLTALQGVRVLGVCGIARPAGFEATLDSLGANVRGVLSFPDHHLFTAVDVATIESAARAEHCDLILTTEKDAVRLARVTSGEQYRAVAMTVAVHDPAALNRFIHHYVPGLPAEVA